MKQQIRFCRSFDGTRIAFAVTGNGPPLVRAPHWLTHLEYEWQSPIWRPWLSGLGAGSTLVRMDERGCGLSDRGLESVAFEAYVRDLEAVADASGLERFALFGHSQGGAIALEYAARHSARVSRLVLLGAYARGRFKRPNPNRSEADAQLKLVEFGWGGEDPSYRQFFANQFMPGASREQIQHMAELQRVSSSPTDAVHILRSFYDIDVSAALSRIACPTLVLHARGDLRVPFEEGRLLAASIPGARFVALESKNHILLDQEPAFGQFFEEVQAFLGQGQTFADLTAREAEILEHIAQGLDNAQIAARLALSEKTVRNHITSVFDKIGAENRSQAIVMARERGLGQRSHGS
jgi:pimeloyl-ACP methyl ester carboxylesterase/DNA-binding CsgD family transcriptional regulator